MCIDATCRRRSAAGFSLVELVIFIVVVSIGLFGIISVLNVTVRGSSDPLLAKQALTVAESLMEEIQGKDFDNTSHGSSDFVPSTPPAVSERQNFDNVADFNNYGAASLSPTVLRAGLYDIAGNAIAMLANYRLLVTVAQPPAAFEGIATGNVWVISVQVTDSSNQTYTVTGYRINHD